jgi:hypothetical protein
MRFGGAFSKPGCAGAGEEVSWDGQACAFWGTLTYDAGVLIFCYAPCDWECVLGSHMNLSDSWTVSSGVGRPYLRSLSLRI